MMRSISDTYLDDSFESINRDIRRFTYRKKGLQTKSKITLPAISSDASLSPNAKSMSKRKTGTTKTIASKKKTQKSSISFFEDLLNQYKFADSQELLKRRSHPALTDFVRCKHVFRNK